MELQAVTGRLYVIDGAAQEPEKVPGILAQSPPSKAARGRAADSLFVNLSLSGSPADYAALAQDLLDAISARYYTTSGSITAALRTAILEANQLLLNLNLSRTGVQREGAVSCAVLHDQELFVVQSGEAFALIGRNFGVERLPAKPLERITPMGRTAGLDLRYFHNWLEPGDMLLLPDPRMAHLSMEALQSALVDSTVEDSLPLLASILEGETARLLLVEFTDEPPPDLPDSVSPPIRPSLQAVELSAIAASQAATARRLPPPTSQPQREDQRGKTPTSMPAEGHSVGRHVDVNIPSAEDIEYGARKASSRTAMGLSRATGWFADLMGRLQPPAEGEADAEQNRSWALPAMLAVFIPLIVAIVVVGVYIQRGQVTRMSDIRQEMQQSLGLAEQAESEADAREQYDSILRLAAEAETLRPGDDDVLRMRREALVELDRIDDVTRLQTDLLYRYDEGTQITGVVLREGLNGDIYTLDSANNRVFLHKTEDDFSTFTEESPQQILFEGQAVGTHVVGNLIDMMWRPSGTQVSESGAAILDGRGALLTFHPTFANIRAVPLGLASDWVGPIAIGQFNERLYVLDPGAGQIWRYFPEGDGFYVDESERTLDLPDLEASSGFAIYSEDGSVVMIYGDGRVRRYGRGSLLWDENTLLQNGLDSPLVSPTRVKIIGRGLNSSIFIADPGSGRIVQVSLGGSFLAQYKAFDPDTGNELFTELGDFDVVDAPLRLFVSAGDSLHLVTQE
jgi:hypothetical protein